MVNSPKFSEEYEHREQNIKILTKRLRQQLLALTEIAEYEKISPEILKTKMYEDYLRNLVKIRDNYITQKIQNL